jgi:hypothetical protein
VCPLSSGRTHRSAPTQGRAGRGDGAADFGGDGLIPICIQMVAQVFNLCMCRLKPADTPNYLMIVNLIYYHVPGEIKPINQRTC